MALNFEEPQSNLHEAWDLAPKVLQSGVVSINGASFLSFKGISCKIITASLCNISATPATVSVHVSHWINGSTSYTDETLIMAPVIIDPNETFNLQMLEGLMLGSLESIHVSSSLDNAIVWTMTGLMFTGEQITSV